MGYKLAKPYTQEQRNNFLSKYHRQMGLRTQETSKYLFALETNEIVENDEILINKFYTDILTQQRENDFKSLFFEIEGLGWFRRNPKGYNSAVESANTAFNIVSIMQKLPANTMTFYKAPDFTKEEQCTEQWLIENSFKNEEMTIEQFAQFYANFMTAWNNQEHKN